MTIALIGNTTIAGGANGGTSSGIDTSGATLIVIHVSRYQAGGAVTVSDNKSNTWTPLTERSGDEPDSRLYYATNPTVGSGHTFTASGSACYSVAQIAFFSGVVTTSPFDVENGVDASNIVTSRQPGSVTPGQDNSLVVTGQGYTAAETQSVDSGFTITNQQNYETGVNEGGALAYIIQTTAGAVNPTWSSASDKKRTATIAVFKPATGGGAVTGTGTLTAPAVTAAGTGTIKHVGTGALTIPAVTAAGTGTLEHTGTGVLTVPVTTLAGAGQLTHKGTGDITTGAVTLAGAGTQSGAQTGTGTLTTPAATITGTGVIKHTGTGDLTIGPVVLDGQARVPSDGGIVQRSRQRYSIPDEPHTRKRRIIYVDRIDETIEAEKEKRARKQVQEPVERIEIETPETIAAEIRAIESHLAKSNEQQRANEEQRNLALLQSGVILLAAQQLLDEDEFAMLMLMAA